MKNFDSLVVSAAIVVGCSTRITRCRRRRATLLRRPRVGPSSNILRPSIAPGRRAILNSSFC